MANKRLDSTRAHEAVMAVNQHGGNLSLAAASMGVARTTLQSRLRAAALVGLIPSPIAPPGTLPNGELEQLRRRLKMAEKELSVVREARISEDIVRNEIIGLRDNVSSITPPVWLAGKHNPGLPGVPSLFLSDLHWGECVNESQINFVNSYSMAIAKQRLEKLAKTSVQLLKIISPKMEYPGLVLILGGDMISGNIHDELAATNEFNTMPTVLDLYGELVRFISAMLLNFPRVFIPCVTGNHGRDTHKIWNKDRHATSFDWLLYCFLAKHFEGDRRVTFFIPDGNDAYYKIYNHRYLLTHGDKLGNGGDGMIGALGPIVRGDHKKRSRNTQINMEYDTLLLGHWHQLIQLERLIVNGCFPASMLVSTAAGVRPISQCNIGDRVISHDGSVQTITHVFQKTSAHGLVHLKVRGLPEPLSATPNHLIWAIKSESKRCRSIGVKWDNLRGGGDMPQWIPMDFISPGDYVSIPRRTGTDKTIDAETAWAWGLYLAEGSTLLDGGTSKKHNRIVLTMHERELSVLVRFAKWFEEHYGIAPRTYIRTKSSGAKTSELCVSPGREICAQFRAMFGHLAHGKHLPPGALELAPELCTAILQGWIDGDGHITATGTTSATTISYTLAHEMFMLALSADMRPSLSKLSAGGQRKHDSYTLHFNCGQESIELNGELFYRVHARYRNREVVPVYDLEVSGVHTYTVGFIGVHNSLKGYDEFAYIGNFPFEPPQQAMWITHQTHGITFRIPVKLEHHADRSAQSSWVSVQER